MVRKEGRMALAADIAKAVAPYVHPKLSSIKQKDKNDAPRQITRIEHVIIDPPDHDARWRKRQSPEQVN